MAIEPLTVAFNNWFGASKTFGQIKSTLTNHSFVCGRKNGNSKGISLLFTKAQTQFIRDNYPRHSLLDLTAELNRQFKETYTVQQLKSFTKNHGITCGRTGCFEKGRASWNKGTKGVMQPNSGNFKPGAVPPNKQPLWHERVDSRQGFILINVPERNPYTGHSNRYKHKHVWVWEQVNGPVPKGMVVSFVDGNKQNCNLENLMLITRGLLLLLNQHNYANQPAELRPSILALARVEAAAGFRTLGRIPGAGRKKKEL